MKTLNFEQMVELEGGSGAGCIAGVAARIIIFVSGMIVAGPALSVAAAWGIAGWYSSILTGCLFY